MDDMDCPTTYHMGEDLDLTQPPQREDSGMNKPPALWASPGRVDDEGSVRTAWTDYMVYGDGKGPSEDHRLFALTPIPGALIIRLDSEEDIRAFGNAYPDFATPGHQNRLNAWAKVASDEIDAVMLTEAGASAARKLTYQHRGDSDVAGQGLGDALCEWDVASVCWLRNDNLDVEEVRVGLYPDHEITPEEEEEEREHGFGFTPIHDLDPVDGPRTYEQGKPTGRPQPSPAA